MKTTITRITNEFTGYDATVRTKGTPTVSTIKKHIRNSRAGDCMSVTHVRTNCDNDGCFGDHLEIIFGEIFINGYRV